MSDDADLQRMIRNLHKIKGAMRGDEPPASPIVKRVVFGTTPDCDVVVKDEYVSNRHCAFNQHEDGTITVEDLGSTNGTTVRRAGQSWIAGTKVYTPQPIGPGTVVRIGHTDLPWDGNR